MSRLNGLVDVNARIPFHIHQIWLDKRDDNAPPPAKYNCAKYMQSIARHNSHYEITIWSMKMVQDLFENYPQIRRWKHFYFHGLKYWIEKCDFIRYIIMWLFGGVYCDLDMTAHQSFDAIVKNRAFTWCVDWIHCNMLTLGAFEGKFTVFNGVIASAPNQPIWEKLCDYIMYRYETQPPGLIFNTTGPLVIGNFCNLFQISDEHAYPELYVNRCLIIGEGFMVSKKDLDKNPCTNINPVVSTEWTDGSSWQQENALFYVNFYIERKHIAILLSLVALCILLFILFYRKRQQLQLCENEVKVCQNSG